MSDLGDLGRSSPETVSFAIDEHCPPYQSRKAKVLKAYTSGGRDVVIKIAPKTSLEAWAEVCLSPFLFEQERVPLTLFCPPTRVKVCISRRSRRINYGLPKPSTPVDTLDFLTLAGSKLPRFIRHACLDPIFGV
jgi:hypothetical protein